MREIFYKDWCIYAFLRKNYNKKTMFLLFVTYTNSRVPAKIATFVLRSSLIKYYNRHFYKIIIHVCYY